MSSRPTPQQDGAERRINDLREHNVQVLDLAGRRLLRARVALQRAPVAAARRKAAAARGAEDTAPR